MARKKTIETEHEQTNEKVSVSAKEKKIAIIKRKIERYEKVIEKLQK